MQPWARVQRTAAVLRPCWFAALVSGAAVLLVQVPQSRDLLRGVAEGWAAGRAIQWAQWAFLIAGVLALAGCAWYFSRAVLYVRYWTTPEPVDAAEMERFERARRWAPRVLGALPILGVALAYWLDGYGAYAVVFGVLALAFLAAVILRRRLIDDDSLRVPAAAMPPTTFRVLLGLLAGSFLLLVGFLLFPVGLPRLLGTAAIVFIAGASWIAFASLVLIHPTYHYRLPSLLFLGLALSAVFSLWNDNHAVRRLDPAAGAPPPAPQSVDAHMADWLDRRRAPIEAAAAEGRRYPVFVVAAEGGGIRAAYWAASVLAALEEARPGFACHVLAVSGVSGGSLGAAVFAALLAGEAEAGRFRCDRPAAAGPLPGLSGAARAVLGEDFLAPAAAGMLFPDLLQRFSPFSDQRPFGGALAFPDRASYLERAWETAYEDRTGGDRLAGPFHALWAGGGRYDVPSLLLNGTWVDTGGRFAVSNLDVGGSRFVRLDDIADHLAAPVRVSTAALLSARFTYVSPAGTVRGPEGRVRYAVDGGYFENSGALTAADLLIQAREAARGICGGDGGWCDDDVEFVGLILTNNPGNPNIPQPEPAPAATADDDDGGRHQMLMETLAPALALYHAQGARGGHAEASFERATGGHCLRVALAAPERYGVPLGWFLSEATRAAVDGQLDPDKGPHPQLDAVLARLLRAGRAGGASACVRARRRRSGGRRQPALASGRRARYSRRAKLPERRRARCPLSRGGAES